MRFSSDTLNPSGTLIGHQINPWTVLHAGSSEAYQENGEGQLLPQQRTFFLKGSYYFQPS